MLFVSLRVFAGAFCFFENSCWCILFFEGSWCILFLKVGRWCLYSI